MEGDNLLKEAYLKDFVWKNKEYLINYIDTTGGLLNMLFSRAILTRVEVHEVRSRPTDNEIIDSLIDHIITLNECEWGKLLEVFNETNHRHVTNFIRGRGKRRQEFGDDWPLGDTEIKTLDDNLPQLTELIDPRNGLLERMIAKECLTKTQSDRISKCAADADRNDLLVSQVRRSSVAVFEKFLRCLVETKQRHVVSLLKPELGQGIRPLSAEEKSRIRSKMVELIHSLYVDVVFLAELESANCITTRQRQSIESAQTMSGRCMLLLDRIIRGSQQDFQGFIECLQKTHQASFITLLENEEQQVVVVIENIKLLRNKLLMIVDVEHGLFDELLSLNVLTKQQVEEAQGRSTKISVDLLLNYIIGMSSSEQCEQFLFALEKTQQKHVANYIRSGGIHGDPSNEWPLLDSMSWILNSNYPTVLELIDTTNGLLDELVSVGCISLRHKERIAACPTAPSKNGTLLKSVMRGSITNYNKLIDCLLKTKQYVVAALLAPPDHVGIVPPLTKENDEKLVTHNATLRRLLVTKDGLTELMLDAGCITERQKIYIESPASYSESNGRLLSILKRGSQEDFDKFIGCLEETKQLHIRRILTVVPINVQQLESPIFSDVGLVLCFDARTWHGLYTALPKLKTNNTV